MKKLFCIKSSTHQNKFCLTFFQQMLQNHHWKISIKLSLMHLIQNDMRPFTNIPIPNKFLKKHPRRHKNNSRNPGSIFHFHTHMIPYFIPNSYSEFLRHSFSHGNRSDSSWLSHYNCHFSVFFHCFLIYVFWYLCCFSASCFSWNYRNLFSFDLFYYFFFLWKNRKFIRIDCAFWKTCRLHRNSHSRFFIRELVVTIALRAEVVLKVTLLLPASLLHRVPSEPLVSSRSESSTSVVHVLTHFKLS